MRIKQTKSFDRQTFGNRLKRIREELGITQQMMAKAINRTRSAYVIIEGGKAAPSVDCIIDILREFKKRDVSVTLDYLFGEVEHQNEGTSYQELKKKFEEQAKELAQCQKISHLQEELLKTKTN
jgi:DNA-binding XRE family transcriptional regulator